MNEDNTQTAESTGNIEIASLAADLASAFMSNNHVTIDDIPKVVSLAFTSISEIVGMSVTPAQAEEKTYEPAVSVRSSLASKDHIISLIDGKPYKTLRRHLSRHGLTPDQYRARYGLKPDYPMVSPTYSESRSNMAKKIGLGQKRAAKTDANGDTAPKAKRAPRKKAEQAEAQAA